ncbi:MAG: damage repair protein [Bacilli bacterium]|nr:damage repair protein [Bacilli bacterium]
MKTKRNIAVIDLKAFYSFVECLDRGLDPFTTPLVVCDKERGKNTIVLSVTPYLKKHGVPSRLRIRDLPKKFNYVYAVPRMERYIEKSSEVISILLDFFSEEDIHVYSIDEAFVDMTSYLKYYKMNPFELVRFILNTIKERTGLSATAGIGPNFFLSKVALDIYAKHEPSGIAVMNKEDIKTKLWPITPLSKIWGIGERMEARLNAMGLFTVEDIALSSKEYFIQQFGVMGEQLINHANGIDESYIREEYIPKDRSLSIGQVLFKDYTKNEIPLIIREMSDDLSLRLRLEGKVANGVSLYIGYSKEGGFSRQLALNRPTNESSILYDALMVIFDKFIQDFPIRRVGLNFHKLIPIPDYEQLNLFEDPEEAKERRSLQKTLDEIQMRYGKNAVLRASSLFENSTIKERHSQIGGHRK